MPSGERNVSERQCWGTVFIQWLQCSLAFSPSLAIFQVGAISWHSVGGWNVNQRLLGWVSILLKPNQTKNRSWHNSLILLLSTNNIDCSEYGRKVGDMAATLHYKAKPNILKLVQQRGRKGLGLLSQCWGVTMALNCLPTFTFLIQIQTVKTQQLFYVLHESFLTNMWCSALWCYNIGCTYRMYKYTARRSWYPMMNLLLNNFENHHSEEQTLVNWVVWSSKN